MHRQVALRQATVERCAEMATYLSECALLLARVSSNLCLSDDLKRRILCTFLSLMNLRGTLERAPSAHPPEIGVPAPGLAVQFSELFRQQDRSVPLRDSARPAGLGPPPACSTASQSKVEVRSQSPSATGGSSSSLGKPAPLRFGR